MTKGQNSRLVIDLSYQDLTHLHGVLPEVMKAEHLVLDGNNLSCLTYLPHCPNLRTLSLNKNQIKNIEKLIHRLKECCPNLRYLSLIENPGWPYSLRVEEWEYNRAYSRARDYVSEQLLDLRFLDSKPVQQKKANSSGTIIYMKQKYHYIGHNSEGNRFIKDNEL